MASKNSSITEKIETLSKTSKTTLDKLSEIKRYFDVSGDYNMYVLDNGQKVAIPIDDEIKLHEN